VHELQLTTILQSIQIDFENVGRRRRGGGGGRAEEKEEEVEEEKEEQKKRRRRNRRRNIKRRRIIIRRKLHNHEGNISIYKSHVKLTNTIFFIDPYSL
jgi:hypothetical protein